MFSLCNFLYLSFSLLLIYLLFFPLLTVEVDLMLSKFFSLIFFSLFSLSFHFPSCFPYIFPISSTIKKVMILGKFFPFIALLPIIFLLLFSCFFLCSQLSEKLMSSKFSPHFFFLLSIFPSLFFFNFCPLYS